MLVNVLDLFSGVGMFSYGLHKLGWQTVAFAEPKREDKYAPPEVSSKSHRTVDFKEKPFIPAGVGVCDDVMGLK